MAHKQVAIKTLYFSILSNVCLAIIKGVAGFLGNSYAMLADALESTSDVFTSILILLGIKYATRPADKNHPYGHGRIEPLITFVVVGILIVTATLIAYESIENIRTPHEAPAPWTLIILGAIIIWKEISYQVVIRKSRALKSSSLKAEAWHHRSDAFTSIAAFIGIAVALILGKGFEAADDWAALFASGFILYNCYHIFRPALSEIMDEHTYDEEVFQIKSVAKTVEGIVDTEKCFIRKSGMKFHLELHALVDGNISVKQGHYLAHKLQDVLKKELNYLDHIIIHIEPFEGEIMNS